MINEGTQAQVKVEATETATNSNDQSKNTGCNDSTTPNQRKFVEKELQETADRIASFIDTLRDGKELKGKDVVVLVVDKEAGLLADLSTINNPLILSHLFQTVALRMTEQQLEYRASMEQEVTRIIDGISATIRAVKNESSKPKRSGNWTSKEIN